MVRFRTLAAALAVLTCCPAQAQRSSSRAATTKVNVEAFNWAASLIARGQFVADTKGNWNSDHPTRAQENDFLRDHGFQQYAKWYLAVDWRHAANSKARHKFPFGDFRSVHRCGLLAIKARAHEYGYPEIEQAAVKLLRMIESAVPRAKKGIN
jgi:hypothetical protein